MVSVENELIALKGMRPGLVHDLATLHGQTLADIQVTVQIMPYGDRAVLAAYNAVDQAHRPKVLPLMASLVEEAYAIVLEAVRHKDIVKVVDNRWP